MQTANATIYYVIGAIVLIAIVAAIIYAVRAARSRELEKRFGPEYDRLLKERGDKAAAERELAARQDRVKRFHIEELPAGARSRYSEEWRSVQSRFVDEPQAAGRRCRRPSRRIRDARSRIPHRQLRAASGRTSRRTIRTSFPIIASRTTLRCAANAAACQPKICGRRCSALPHSFQRPSRKYRAKGREHEPNDPTLTTKRSIRDNAPRVEALHPATSVRKLKGSYRTSKWTASIARNGRTFKRASSSDPRTAVKRAHGLVTAIVTELNETRSRASAARAWKAPGIAEKTPIRKTCG